MNKFEHLEIAVRPDGTLWELGRGITGITYKAFDPDLQADVALKIINPQYFQGESNRQEFIRCGRAAAEFRHPNIAALLQIGISAGRLFYTTEYVEGESVQDRVAREGPLHPLVALRIVSQIARVFVAASRRALVHGNLKPSNVILSFGGLVVKVLDFGLFRGGVSAPLPGGAGTEALNPFASPDHAQRRDGDLRSDIYSLGATLWYMLIGRLFLAGTTIDHQLPADSSAKLSSRILKVLEKMLSPLPENRFQTSAELKSALDQLMTELKDEPVTELIQDPAEAHGSPSRGECSRATRNDYLIGRESASEANVYHAKHLHSDATMALLPLPGDATYDPQWLNNLQVVIAKLQAAPHPNLREIIALDSDDRGFFLVKEWIDGISWEELSRSLRQRTISETLPILRPLADALDFAAECKLPGKQVSLKDIFVDLEGRLEGPSTFPAGTIASWPPFTVKVDLLNLSSPIDMTETAHTRDGSDTSLQNPVKHMSLLVCQLLCRKETAAVPAGRSPGFHPLANLPETVNALLRAGASDPTRYATAKEFLEHLVAAEGSREESVVSAPRVVEAGESKVQPQKLNTNIDKGRVRRSAAWVSTLARTAAMLVFFGAGVFFAAHFLFGKSIPPFAMLGLHVGWRNTAVTAPALPDQNASVPKAGIAAPPAEAVPSGDRGIKQNDTPTASRRILAADTATRAPGTGATATPEQTGRVSSSGGKLDIVRPDVLPSTSTLVADRHFETIPVNAEKSASPIPKTELAQLSITSDPPGQRVEIIDAAQKVTTGLTPMTLENEPVGHYAVKIEREGWPDYREDVELLPNARLVVNHAFEPVKMTLKSDPDGATIFMGTTELGKTPLTVSLPPKPVELVSRVGSLTAEVQRVVPDPKGANVVEFRHSYGTLSVRSDRPDAEIVFSGVNRGKLPFEGRVAPGQYEVLGRAPGMPDQTKTVGVQPGQKAELQFNFSTAPVPATPSSTPAGQESPTANITPSDSHRESPLHPQAHRRPPGSSRAKSIVAKKDSSCPVGPERKGAHHPERLAGCPE